MSVSPLLLERYLSSAAKLSRTAVGETALQPTYQTYDVPRGLVQLDRMSEEMPFGSRGGIAVKHYFPLDGEYLIKVRMQRTETLYVRGTAEPQPVDVRLDGRGRPQMLEVNPLAGLTPDHSDLPIMAALSGMEYRTLIAEILRCTTARLASEATQTTT